ncbi:ribosomal RNA small subunit methyltransferase H [Methylocystis bryophila]|nr:ribosomal RNA small subunit methyltransferase H [Methylocystis bryophila]
MLSEAIAALDPRAEGRYLDATFGAGGYSRALLETEGARVLALDRDPAAVRDGAGLVEAARGRLKLVEARFSKLEEVAAREDFLPLHGAVFDIGVSSMQLDQPERGFSFREDGPLDMRMGGSGPTAADLVNTASEEKLADVFYYFGEERAARRIARAIVHDRQAEPFLTTGQLAGLIARVAPQRHSDIHPATRSFQALRIAVNDELAELVEGLCAAERALAPDGRLAVVTFHSLEDRLVKLFLAARSGRGETRSRRLPGEPTPPPQTFRLEGRQPVAPLPGEIAANPRARSAKLRVAVRTAAPARDRDEVLAQRARLPAAPGERS